MESTASTACYTNFSDAAACKPQGRGRTRIRCRHLGARGRGAAHLAVAQQPVQAHREDPGRHGRPGRGRRCPACGGRAHPGDLDRHRQLRLRSRCTPMGGPLGSAQPAAADDRRRREDQEYTVVVPAGAQRLDVAIGNPDAAADLDLTVVPGRHPGGGQSADGDSEERSRSPTRPPARTTVAGRRLRGARGHHGVRLPGRLLPPGTGLGSVPSTARCAGAGEGTTVTGTVTATAAAAGRQAVLR